MKPWLIEVQCCASVMLKKGACVCLPKLLAWCPSVLLCFACLQPDVTPQMFVAELRNFVAGVEVWWEGRNARRPAGDQGAAAGELMACCYSFR